MTPRLRLAAGKALRERTVPVHEEAAQAIRDLVKLREAQPDQGIFDPDLGQTVRYLFLRNGVLANADYLFASPLAQICDELAILNGDGKPAIQAHRFRHTLGTQLAEKAPARRPPSTRRGSGTACAWRGNWPTTPKSAAGTVKPTVTSAPPTASEACSANSANPPAGQKARTEWATVLPTADPPTA